MANLRANKITTGTADYQGSIYASGVNAYLLTTTTAPGTDDFTIECWINSDNASGTNQEGLFAINGQSAGSAGYQAGTSNQLRLVQGRDGTDGQNGGLEVNIVGTAVGTGDGNDIIQEGTWHHVAVTRASGTVKIWVDGVEKASGSAAGDVTGTTFITAYYDGNYTYQGYMSNFRYRKGTAHYTTTFTPPTGPLERTSDTELLFAQSANNAGDGYSSAIHGGTTDIMKVLGNVTANTSAPTLTTSSSVGVVFEGDTKVNSLGHMYFPTGTTTQRGRGRGVFGGGYTSVPANASVKRIYYIQIDSMGIGAEFGDTNKAAAWGQSGCSSSTRGLITGGTTPTNLNTIDYITIATTSNALDFGDLSIQHGYTASCSNNTRGLTGGGRGGSPVARTAQIDYNTIATTGNGQDFGDLTQSRMGLGAVASSTRAVFTGGNGSPADPSTVYNIIDYVEFATTGNATDFGDMTDEHTYHGSCSSSTRGIIYGGVTSYGPTVTTDIIEYVTIASTGNGTDFGNVRDDGAHAHGTSNSIRGVFAGGVDPYRNSIDFVTIATTGNGVDWGDLPITSGSYAYAAGLSDSHGGIS